MKLYARPGRILLVLLMQVGIIGHELHSATYDSTEVIEKWVDVTNLISIEVSEWKELKALLTYNIDLLNTEITDLEQLISQSEEQAREAERKTDLLRDEESNLRNASTIVDKKVTDYENRIRNLSGIFPPALNERIIQFMSRLPAEPGTSTMPLEERLATVLNILEEVDKFNNSVTVVSELKLVSSGDRVEVKTMYLGLAHAFYVDRNIEFAGVGIPVNDQWEWTSHPELSENINRSILMYENAIKPAEFIPLSVTID